MPIASRLMLAARHLPRHALAWLVAVLLLQAAVPLLAALAAKAQGVTTAEVCSIYGVRTVSLDADGRADPAAPAQDEQQAHDGGHCVLTPLFSASLHSPQLASVVLHAPVARRFVHTGGSLAPPDATQAWVAARKHGPPLSA